MFTATLFTLAKNHKQFNIYQLKKNKQNVIYSYSAILLGSKKKQSLIPAIVN